MSNKRGWIARLCALTVDATPAALLLGALGLAAVGFTSATGYSCPAPDALPRPSSKPLNDYESVLGRFLEHRCYAAAGWASDKYVRNAGPHLVYLDKGEKPAEWDAVSAGSHNAVWIYYSTGVYQWMLGHEQRSATQQLQVINGLIQRSANQAAKAEPATLPPIPNGAMIIKEMWAAPAQQYPPSPPPLFGGDGKPNPKLNGGAVMVKDIKGAPSTAGSGATTITIRACSRTGLPGWGCRKWASASTA